MAGPCRTLPLQIVCLAALLNSCFGSYAITTPRKWTPGERTQVCVVLLNATSESRNEITVELTSEDESELVLPGKVIRVPEGQRTWCASIFVPDVSHQSLLMKVTGTLTDKKVEDKKKIILALSMTKTFIQTDKPLYKPGEDVQFRILTVAGPFLRILETNYNVWIETPSGSRIAQWTDVDNSAGLVHLSFRMADEPQEGQYAIKVRLQEDGSTTSHMFKVEEYVLPRFEVSVTTPKYILGSDTEFTFTVCANYTFGQPVTGSVTLEVEGCSWTTCKDKHVLRDMISGCKKFNVTYDDLEVNGEDFMLEKLNAKAIVVEEETEQEAEGEASTIVKRAALHFSIIGKEEFMKPNLPFTVKATASLLDESPLVGELIKVCVNGICRHLTTGPDGILEFVIPPYSMQSVTLEAVSYPESVSTSGRYFMHKSKLFYTIPIYNSPSKSSLAIDAPEGRLPCTPDGHNHTLQVLFAAVNQTKALVSVQVVSRGQIQFSSAEEYEFSPSSLPIKEEHLFLPLPPTPEDTIIGVLKIPIHLPPTISPAAKVLVWYTRPDGEVVSDTQDIAIEKCLGNEVNLVWSSDTVLPGAQATLRLSASPNSLCSLGVVSKNVESLYSQTAELTLDKVFDFVEKAMTKETGNSQYSDEDYCKTLRERNPQGASPSRGSSLPLVQRRRVRRPRGYIRSTHVDALKMFDKSGLYILTDGTTETRPCNAYHFRPSFYDSDADSHDSDADEQKTSFTETWLWKINMTDASGVLSEQYTLPDTITEWVGKAVCVSPETGLGISQRAAITTFTPFFVDLTLPPSIKRGEVLPVKISVFNYLDQALPVKVILEESSDYEMLQENDNGLPVGHSIASIAAQQKIVFTVKIRPLVLGDVNITINTFANDLFQEIDLNKTNVLTKLMKVEAEGFLREKTQTKYMCCKGDYRDRYEDCGAGFYTQLPSAIVEDSARGWITLGGDLLGPALENLGSLVKMPYGCGEQNMLNFASNIIILQYLEASNQTTPEIAAKAIGFLRQGYQRELRYHHKDGSFSAFGSSDASGSTWLTAFVLKSFAKARHYIQIDENDLKRTRDWLEMKQLENGCFQSVGKAFTKGMKGGIDGSSSLTSFVLIALLESGGLSTSKVAMDAANCLHADTSKDPYTLALKAYALALSEAPEANQALQNLLNVATESSDSLHWELSAGLGKSKAVETAGYAILAMMTLDTNLYDIQTRKIVKWISSQRNGQGGFVSTQDTAVALQALATYEAHGKTEPPFFLINVMIDGGSQILFLGKSNKLLQTHIDLPYIPTNVVVDRIQGHGCFHVQAVLRYNVPEASASDAFALIVSTETVPDKKCITKRIKACASYLLPDQKSNMAIMEFNLISGYIPHKDDLKQIVGNGTGLLKRYEVDGNKVEFYIDEISPEDICVQFRIIRKVDVEDAKPGTVKVYDYYQPELFVGQTYVLPPPDDCQTEEVPLQMKKSLNIFAIIQRRLREVLL